MDKCHVSKAILSVSSPGTHICHGDDALARKITRQANDEVAQMVASCPERLGFFASLPLPDIEGSLEEIDYALDTLNAAGFVVMTNAHGIYLGDSSLDRVFEKLNQRKAVIFMHPTSCHVKEHPKAPKPLDQYPSPMLEFIFDTVRAVANLILSGTVSRNPDVTFLVSHAGAAIPPLMERFANFSKRILRTPGALDSSEMKELFKKQFYFDLAGFPFPDQIHGLLRITDTSRLLYGSDFPYTPAEAVEHLGRVLDTELPSLFDQDAIKEIYFGNAERVLAKR